ncbi:response regulator transcription factor [Streptomyces endophyticus]|uniref:Response regulator transcription factor n=1 Tax=Streptomyces endophyticus TaxID=714166 RepID=A0ABU6FN77_9ACTN|nr:response regulator transcription factor [Streptomyces endophyticus]MEB8344247.1 response regulator transcription factor [Streptomyces endophyticus]
MIRVLVVEDQRAMADALEIALGVQPDLDCVGAVRTVEEALPLVASHSPHVVLMDIHLPGADGIEGTRRIRAEHPRTRVLLLTADTDPGQLVAATSAGAAGFLAKDSAFPAVLAAIRAPAEGPMFVEESTLGILVAAIGSSTGAAARSRRAAAGAGLTAREREVLRLMGRGLGPRAIAERLVVSPHTARGHVKRVMAKLGAHSQLEAVVAAARSGLLRVSGDEPRDY